ncbi:hypothetical protein DK530_00525 [Salmonella enterica]|uniref:Uncharacterized protein n=1 Tax=Enterobacter cloacae subsp. cloacae (strain ATCC 13047 / DSM 30054 / NBRC 13535 / NCTC 10005 / WDCM 00083 / NCDC 279-56) TaxID=716541 RepID=A0A0H3CU69_ENTCC|nr:hypothetical protein ECL_A132 [Enterobacter cloacae subsp. cloacae ATCC 13047]AKZ86902.1 hypothetical protein LI65_025455 [Enterobacter hormaechei subsp. steigerwaltii]EBI9066678.1 hypothetical protein [Salmonella enterica]KLQ04198.1 hypothetical protein ABF75_06975 [Enterobacter hormaechei subsp. xiangfangensis]KTJ26781.1 hypothetical protein ASU87_22520 [Enterobacter roggenkampii]KTK17644.1 hypothetical protein ASU67_22185 [Enterobacter hormaechei subsp. hoffmannii]KVJ86316.1 hypothetica
MRVRRSPAGASAADLAEWGSTTGPPRGPGAEGGHRPALFSGYSHGAADAKVNRQDAGYDARDKEHRAHQAEARYEQVAHRVSNSTKSGRTGRGEDQAEGAEGQRRRRVPLPPFPAGEQPFPEVQACGRVGKEKGATGEPATPS